MNWPTLLENISSIIHEHVNDNAAFYHKTQIENNWLGYPPCSNEAILQKEIELGIQLPLSYKNFLLTSNGFQQLSFWTGQLLPLEEVGFLKNKEPLIYKIYEGEKEEHLIPDEEYLNYDQVDSSIFIIDHLLNALVISKNVDRAILMLNPKIQFAQECEAWVFASWAPGAFRYPSFKALVRHEINTTINLLNEDKPIKINTL